MKLTSTNINNYIKKKDSTYKIFDINYTQKEKEIINKIDIKLKKNFDFYGKFDKDKLINCRYEDINIIDYLKLVCDNDELDIIKLKKIMYKLIEIVTNGYKKKYIWFHIETTLPNTDFKIPRWHTDGYNGSKFITLLQGPGTLVIKDSDKESRKIFFEIQDKMSNEMFNEPGQTNEVFTKIYEKYRKIFAKKLKPLIDQPNNNQGLIFLTDRKFAAIHSEPDKNKKRLFISILCGTKNYIMNLHKP